MTPAAVTQNQPRKYVFPCWYSYLCPGLLLCGITTTTTEPHRQREMPFRQIWCLYQFLFNAVRAGTFVGVSHQDDGQSFFWPQANVALTHIHKPTSWVGSLLLPTTKGPLCAKPFSSTNIWKNTHARTQTDELQCTGKSGHTHIHRRTCSICTSRFARNNFLSRGTKIHFRRPRDSQSPAEMRAVMATEENSGCSMRACLLGQAAPEQRIEMQQKSGLKELVMSVCPITTRKLTMEFKIMNKSGPLYCAEDDTVSRQIRYSTPRRKPEINVQRCELITSQKPEIFLLINKSFFSYR